MKRRPKLIKSHSGDWFEIPAGRLVEYRIYKEAVARGDEKVMLLFEEGWTGWKYKDSCL